MNSSYPVTSSRIPIATVEEAINAWRNRQSSASSQADDMVLCAEARALADVYGQMIFDGANEIDAATLNTAQRAALDNAFV